MSLLSKTRDKSTVNSQPITTRYKVTYPINYENPIYPGNSPYLWVALALSVISFDFVQIDPKVSVLYASRRICAGAIKLLVGDLRVLTESHQKLRKPTAEEVDRRKSGLLGHGASKPWHVSNFFKLVPGIARSSSWWSFSRPGEGRYRHTTSIGQKGARAPTSGCRQVIALNTHVVQGSS